MKNIVPKIIFLFVCVGVLIFIPKFNFISGIKNFKQVESSYHQSKQESLNSNNTQDSLSIAMKKITDARPKGTPNLDSPDQLYNAIKNLPGVTSIRGDVIKFNSNTNFTILGEFNPNEPNTVLQGVQFTVHVKDLKTFTDALGKLYTPYNSLSIVTVQKEVIIRYNTQGGVC